MTMTLDSLMPFPIADNLQKATAGADFAMNRPDILVAATTSLRGRHEMILSLMFIFLIAERPAGFSPPQFL